MKTHAGFRCGPHPDGRAALRSLCGQSLQVRDPRRGGLTQERTVQDEKATCRRCRAKLAKKRS